MKPTLRFSYKVNLASLLVLLLLLGRTSTCNTVRGVAEAFSSRTATRVPHRLLRTLNAGTIVNAAITTTMIKMARPGQSEAQQKQEREAEIRAKLAQLKSAGKMKGGTAESTMAEAENFFNQESPVRKLERRIKEQKQKEAEEQERLKKESSD
mmetsp:Transcript_2085/g.3186  ORF Transcript_2085/g.3186 Transcript_2085/m.3186 type:complete len:153 (-) Transcript_2085:318-776(-)